MTKLLDNIHPASICIYNNSNINIHPASIYTQQTQYSGKYTLSKILYYIIK